MNKIKTILPIVAVLILLNGCVTYYPQVVDLPLITEKGDIRIDAGAFLIPDIKGTKIDSENKSLLSNVGIHATFTAGITDLLAVQTYASVDLLLRCHIQGALGLYNRFENNTVIEMYSGLGYGNRISSLSNNRTNVDLDDYCLTFAQLNFGKTNFGSKHIDCGLGVKGGYLFTNIPTYYSLATIYKKDGWLIEPTVFIRFGGSRAKFNMKINYMWTNTIVDEYYYPVNVSFGVNFHAGKKSTTNKK